MNRTTRFFNGTRDGQPYQGRVTRYVSSESKNERGHFEVEVVIFDRTTGEPHYSFERRVYDTSIGQRSALTAVLKDPDAF